LSGILPDVLKKDLNIVFCGTAAGTASAKAKAYYAGPGNRFWVTLYRVGLTPIRIQPAQFQRVLEYSIGLTDIAKNVSGADKILRSDDFDAELLRRKIDRYRPRVVAFTSKRAAKAFFEVNSVQYGKQPVRVGKTTLFVLPSTSGAARGFWDESPWHQLAIHVAELT